ncbi:hypothetical protein NLM33_23605 [Bradyrhizobium sp. CCGUVB1N3]|uniref:hypothetical protein n=1 Tax=Bradyrhizobium sp. CCGUVB1N3 TaxID=2949629 RepID=UPI0020B2FD44|nr:hypothetical protein [Bradyrhizobium sp. CCGUVB1N3]MCP3473304.1 hypothetical protein [Bradyrhizobium sp. CCGUVB1N3]
MRTMTKFALAATVATVAVPLALHYWNMSGGEDPLGDTLRTYGFVPINPPSNLMEVGSLYYVDPEVREFKAICHADKADLDGAVVSSRSWEMQENLERNGRFNTGVKIDLGWVISGSADKDYVVKVRASLNDVMIEEIPLGANLQIFTKLMSKPQCNEVAMQYLHGGGYVCQGQKILQATAEYKLDRDAQDKLTASAKASSDEIKSLVKLAVESQSDQSVVDKGGRLFAGAALKYGVSMNPRCIAPPDGRFWRVLPRTPLDRAKNFLLFNVVEPMLPSRPDNVQLAAQETRTAERTK